MKEVKCIWQQGQVETPSTAAPVQESAGVRVWGRGTGNGMERSRNKREKRSRELCIEVCVWEADGNVEGTKEWWERTALVAVHGEDGVKCQ